VQKTRSRFCRAAPAVRRSAPCCRRCVRSWSTSGTGSDKTSLALPWPALTPFRREKCQPPPIRCGHSLACATQPARHGRFTWGQVWPRAVQRAHSRLDAGACYSALGMVRGAGEQCRRLDRRIHGGSGLASGASRPRLCRPLSPRTASVDREPRTGGCRQRVPPTSELSSEIGFESRRFRRSKPTTDPHAFCRSQHGLVIPPRRRQSVAEAGQRFGEAVLHVHRLGKLMPELGRVG
jgi:hypothetical protein